MSSRIYVTVPEALALHQVLLARYGGTPGVRDFGALAAALARPQLGYYDSLFEEAAALFESLITAHPFLEGNKRVAFAVTDVFLRLNAVKLTASGEDVFQWLNSSMEANALEYEHILAWLQENSR